jgi:hypothetical protein
VKSVTRRILVIVLACALSLVYASTASANLLDVMVQDYVQDQQLDACKYTQQELRTLKNLIPNDIKAYDSGFVPAVDDALARVAEGDCKKGGKSQLLPVTPTTGEAPPPPSSGATVPPAVLGPVEPRPAAPAPTPEAQPKAAPDVAAHDSILIAARHTSTATAAPFPILALALLVGLFALAGLLLMLARWRAWQPHWLERFRHAAEEAGWRASSTWAEFADFVRFGR